MATHDRPHTLLDIHASATPRARRRRPAVLAFPLLLGACVMGPVLFGACRADTAPAPDTATPISEPTPAPAAPAKTDDGTLAKAIPPEAQPPRVADAPGDLGAASPEPAVAVAPEPEPAAAPTEPRRVLILGDSLAATGFGAMLEKRLDAREDVVCYRKGKSASGLARPDFFDWPAEAAKQLEFRKPDLVIVIMGGNDGQDMTAKNGKRVPWGKPDAWKADYRARMDDFLTALTADDRKVLWLGLPTMGMRSLETKLEMIREIQREAVLDLGDRGRYLDTAPFVTTEDGALLTEAKVGKKLQPIRAEDRIHFTMSGSEYFADKVLPEVLDVLGVDAQAPAASP